MRTLKVRKLVAIFLLAASGMLWSGCKKTGSAATDKWLGNYAALNPQDAFVSIAVTASSDKTLRMQIKSVSGGYIYNYTTLQQVEVNGTQATINENVEITGFTGTYNVQGSATLTGSVVSLNATATHGSDTQVITFNGQRQ